MRSPVLPFGLLAVALALAGCGENKREAAIKKIDHDREILGGVNGAVNAVIRNQADCEVAKPLIEEAHTRIDDARDKLEAPASKQTLDTLEKQLGRFEQICP